MATYFSPIKLETFIYECNDKNIKKELGGFKINTFTKKGIGKSAKLSNKFYILLAICLAIIVYQVFALGIIDLSGSGKLDVEEGSKTFTMELIDYQWNPNVIEVNEGDNVVIEITKSNSEDSDVFKQHSFSIGPPYNINEIIDVGKTKKFQFKAEYPGEFTFECTTFCGSGHNDEKGKLIVKSKEGTIKILDWKNIDTIRNSLKVVKDESQLPSIPYWDPADFNYLMLVTQREYPGGAFKLINTRTLRDFGDIIGVGTQIHVADFHPDKRFAYSISRSGFASKIDLQSVQLVRQIQVGKDSRGVAISADGKYVMYGNYDPHTAVILDAVTLNPLVVIDTGDSRVASVMSVDKQELFAFNLKEGGQTWFVEQKPPFNVVAKFDTGGMLHELNALDKDERYVVATSQKDNKLTIIDTVQLKITGEIPTGKKPHPGPATLDFTNNLWYGNAISEAKITVIDTTTNTIAGYIEPPGIDISKGGGLFSTPLPENNDNIKYILFDIVFGDNHGTLYLVDREAVARGEFGTAPVAKVFNYADLGFSTQGKIIHPEYSYDGKYVLLGGWGMDRIIVLDAEAFPEIKVVKTFYGITPTGIFPAWRVESNYIG